MTAWDGEQGAFWVKWADRFDAGVEAYRERFLAAAAIESTSAVLDVGCGTGQMTREAAKAGGRALGVDLSSPMIELARDRARAVPNAEFLQADAQIHPFPEASFDRVISRHGAMFFGDAEAAFANLARALRPGGRMVLLSWQPGDRNEWASTFRRIFTANAEVPATPPAPGTLADPAATRGLLESAGFTDVRVSAVAEPMFFGRDVEDAAEFIEAQFGWMARDLSEEDGARVPGVLRADMAGHLSEGGVRYPSAAWLVEASR
ncbi:class I SAM-dependent methyltransferase [Amycolatopsis sp. 195334CR]|uniref:class I SAM-dependent methyltransferase n=1 Tax=Amycolatopsis sp. 195334CR TaxID=2814588 RepID=UPI001F5C3B60|nr:class I SAM-dependent methyltransferase [Amycolatopsis sp. 195334CR]